ncbi:variant erythrocyte surface antigen-1 family protein [Babesia caballi]|uniref:Variant erythrocyte surface antigen-1 family protein n=1 Tax=Babesia caballi TaxID=5871 RepID=A0AAV4LPX4_BABCB|nr:variant erythrocyte surface antigen-1 family protein [Babesia caballi]
MGTKQLTDCPSNLKEAIDWILRVTGKDPVGVSQNGTRQLADAVTQLLKEVEPSSPELKSKLAEIKKALNSGGTDGIIGALGDGLKKFKEGIQTSGPSSNVYQALNNSSLTSKVPKAGDIFLGCVPMIFSALSYLYWRCDSKANGEWAYQRFSSNGIHTDIKDFMTSVGYKSSELNVWKTGSQIFTNSQSNFADLAANKKTYSHFVSELKLKSKEKLSHSNTTHPLSVLHYIASLYFTAKQSENSKEAKVSPTTIREMLYFLAALPYSTVYDEFDKFITDQFKTLLKKPEESNDNNLKLDVADSAKPSSGGNDTLSAAEFKQYLLTSCSFSAVVLGRFQGSGTAEKDSDDPWLHKLFCNSEFTFNFPSAPVLFSKLSEYTYALQFQFTFLHGQCGRSPVHGCGWRACRYGQSINNNLKDQIVLSHICPVECAKSEHNNPGNHPKGCNHEKCGEDSNNSPLHAFLTDKLKGFSLSQTPDPSSPNHLDNHPPGSICHVKMGFDAKHLRPEAGTGNYIYSALRGFCGNPMMPSANYPRSLAASPNVRPGPLVTCSA